MTGNQCDTCRTFYSGIPVGWFVLDKITGSSIALFGGSTANRETTGMFCSLKCLTEYVYVCLVVQEK